ncbi:MAG: toll/interleukin-1 receptor domain-containing protein [Parafilimonas sp.]
MKFKKIFFSYSRIDSAFAVKLALDLKKAGFDVWIDQEDIRAGSEWDLEVEKALTTCDCLLFIQSEKSVASANVLDEVYYAVGENKRVIPLVINDCKPPFRISRLQHINFIEDYDSGLAELENNLNSDSMQDIKPFNENETKKNTGIFQVKYLAILLVVALASIAIFYFKDKKPAADQSVSEIAILPENFMGQWTLKNTEPAASDKSGYLKISDAAEGKVNVETSLQFYYPKTNDTLFLSVFNGFAVCNSCVLKNEMGFTDQQIDIGAQKYTILKQNQPGGKKKGDTVLNAGTNNSIRASVSLQLINKDSVILKVTRPDTVRISNEILVQPFTYSFMFKKDL